MNYLSVCSGIEAATVAWHDLGYNPVAFSEIEKFPSEVLAHHYPNVPNLGDMTKYKEWNLDTIKLLVGGTPCQSFSVAGIRKGLDDPRGNLALTYVGILDKFRPKWCIWENVPGVLSSGNGRDFGAFLGALAELGYGFAYRVLDAQNFGVAQRRRRVFVVGCLGGWESAAKVLFESESLSGNIAKGRSKGKEIASYPPNCAPTLCARDYKGIGSFDHDKMVVQAYENHGTDSRIKEIEVSPTVTARWGTGGNNVPLAMGFNTNARPDEMNFLEEQSNTLTSSQNSGVAVGFDSYNLCETGNINQTIKSPQGGVLESIGGCIQNMEIRRFTPIESERLQGFPDNYTNIKENCPDGNRYKALGNSMAVPVMRWIGKRIKKVDNL